jgi:hypothetical protein
MAAVPLAQRLGFFEVFLSGLLVDLCGRGLRAGCNAIQEEGCPGSHNLVLIL